MQRVLSIALAFCLALTVSLDANAKRFGGGKSLGSAPSHQTRQAQPATAPNATAAASNAARPAAAASGASRWLGPLAGIAAGGLLEYAQYSGNYYGTPHRMVEEQRAQGRDVVLEIEVQGAAHIRKVCPDAVFIFVMPPSYETLENRLSGRGTEPPEVVQRRLEAARTELRCAAEYDYIIVNDDLEEARARLGAVIIAARCEARRMKNMIDKVEQNV